MNKSSKQRALDWQHAGVRYYALQCEARELGDIRGQILMQELCDVAYQLARMYLRESLLS
jgi:hypothetical protein